MLLADAIDAPTCHLHSEQLLDSTQGALDRPNSGCDKHDRARRSAPTSSSRTAGPIDDDGCCDDRAAGQHRRGRLYVALAAIAWSTAGLFQRELTVGLATQLAGRALFAMLGIGVFVAFTERGRVIASFRTMGRAGLAVAALMAASSGAFIAALNYTSVANVLFLQGLSPVLAAVFGLAVGERVSGAPGSRWRSRSPASR